MKIDTKYNIGDWKLCQIFPGKFEYCLIVGIYIYNIGDADLCYEMRNGLMIKENDIFNSREEAEKRLEDARNPGPYHQGKKRKNWIVLQ